MVISIIMADLDSCKREIIEAIYEKFFSKEHFYRLFDNVHNYSEYYAFMNKMTFDGISIFINTTFKERFILNASSKDIEMVKNVMTSINAKIKQIIEKYRFEVLRKDIADVNNNVQNTADVVNLFTDIEKNRTATEEEVKKVNSKVEELDNKVNNRLDKLEASMELIISMLQKS